MTHLQTEKNLRFLCVNGETFLHHPAKSRSFHYKVFLNKNFVKLLNFTQFPRSYEELETFLEEHTLMEKNARGKEIIQYLVQQGFLREHGALTYEEERWKKNNWQESLQFHLHTNNLPKMMYDTKDGEYDDVATMQEYVNTSSPPSNYKIYEGKQIYLTKPKLDKTVSLKNLVMLTKSESLNKNLLSRLLYYGFGQIGVRYMRVTGEHIRKTIPSGGARHPIELYLIITNLPEIESGIYHYNVREHALTLCSSTLPAQSEQIIKKHILLDDNRPGFPISVAFIYSCTFARSMFRYRESRSYRVMHFDLGHITQNLSFLAQCYGLNLYSGYSCHEETIEKMIGIDSYLESILAYSVL